MKQFRKVELYKGYMPMFPFWVICFIPIAFGFVTTNSSLYALLVGFTAGNMFFILMDYIVERNTVYEEIK